MHKKHTIPPILLLLSGVLLGFGVFVNAQTAPEENPVAISLAADEKPFTLFDPAETSIVSTPIENGKTPGQSLSSGEFNRVLELLGTGSGAGANETWGDLCRSETQSGGGNYTLSCDTDEYLIDAMCSDEGSAADCSVNYGYGGSLASGGSQYHAAGILCCKNPSSGGGALSGGGSGGSLGIGPYVNKSFNTNHTTEKGGFVVVRDDAGGSADCTFIARIDGTEITRAKAQDWVDGNLTLPVPTGATYRIDRSGGQCGSSWAKFAELIDTDSDSGASNLPTCAAGETLESDGSGGWTCGKNLTSCSICYEIRRDGGGVVESGGEQCVPLDGVSQDGDWSAFSVSNLDDECDGDGCGVKMRVSCP